MIFRNIEFGSDDFRKECQLRHQVLRAPIGLNLFDEDLESEERQRHFGIFDGAQNLVACGIAVEFSPTEAQIRQVAVTADHQKQGYGRQIMRGIEGRLAESGRVNVFLHARISVIGFYERLGYGKTGEEFISVRIPHIRMEKRLVMPCKEQRLEHKPCVIRYKSALW